MAIVNDRYGTVALRERDDFGKFRKAALHRKDAVRNDERGALRVRQFGFEVGHVAVLVAHALGPR